VYDKLLYLGSNPDAGMYRPLISLCRSKVGIPYRQNLTLMPRILLSCSSSAYIHFYNMIFCADPEDLDMI